MSAVYYITTEAGLQYTGTERAEAEDMFIQIAATMDKPGTALMMGIDENGCVTVYDEVATFTKHDFLELERRLNTWRNKPSS